MQLKVNSGKAKDKLIRIAGPRFLIGRDPECQLRPLSDEVSRRHAELKIIAGIVLIVDLGSASGTRVNGRKLTGPASLRTGDRIEIGPLSFTAFLDEPEQPKPEQPKSEQPKSERLKQPKRPKRTTEAEIVSWLIEDEDEDEEPPLRSHDAPKAADGRTDRGSRSALPASKTRRPSESAGEEAFDLLKAMTTRRDKSA